MMEAMNTGVIESTEESTSPISVSISSDEENADMQRAKELEEEINNNKYNYDCHIELVDIYRKLGDLNSMRAAYYRFHECFPLTPKLWLTWLKDEMKIANSQTQQKKVFELFEKAMEDYLSVELWMEYAQYSIGISDLDTTRSILERGLQSTGLHCSEGSLLWDTLREVENAHISLHPEGSENWKIQVNKLAMVFKRQLSVPLIGMENTYQEWKEWSETIGGGIISIDNSAVEWGYKNALQLLEKYKPFEETLLRSNNNDEIYSAYKSYIKSVSEPLTSVCLYERAITQFCLVPELWEEYIYFCLRLGNSVESIVLRALRNCPWNEELWVAKLRVMEKQNTSEHEVMKCFEQGISSIFHPGLELWTAYLEYVHRNSNSTEKLDKSFKQACQQLGFQNDPLFKLSRWHSRLLARRGDMAAARKIWNTLLQHSQNKGQAFFWLEYINLERQYGDHSRMQNIFMKALYSCTDFPQYITEEWLMFNREFGKLETIIDCMREIKHCKSEPSKQENQQTYTGTKRKHVNSNKVDIKKLKTQEKHINVIAKPVEKDPKKSVFISNLNPCVHEDMVKYFFPNAVNVELVYDRKNNSKCYGFVQFETEEEVIVALARDREPIDGRPVFISKLKPDRTKREKVFKYATASEENKLFVRGLPISKNKGEIEEIFKKYGKVDVRLVLHKSGKPKGLAYIEFQDKESANEALKGTNNMDIDGHKISVAISAPPPKKSDYKPTMRTSEPARQSKSRLQVPFIPRTLQITPNEKEKQGQSDKPKINSNADFRNMFFKK